MTNFSIHSVVYITKQYICAIEYGDNSGLSDKESDNIRAWLNSLPSGPNYFNWEGPPEFERCEISGLMSDCIECTIRIED